MSTVRRWSRGPLGLASLRERWAGAALAGLLSLGAATAWAAEPVARPASVERALGALRASSPSLHVTWRAGRVAPALVTQLAVRVEGATAEARARGFVAQHAELFGVPAASLALAKATTAGARTTVRFTQEHAGLPVDGKSATVTLEGDTVVSVVNDTAPITRFDAATIDADRARGLALEAVLGVPASPSLQQAVVRSHGVAVQGGRAVEVYRVSVLRRPIADRVDVLVDAHEGRVIGLADRDVH